MSNRFSGGYVDSEIARMWRDQSEQRTNQRERAFLNTLKFTDRELGLYKDRVFSIHNRLDAWLRRQVRS